MSAALASTNAAPAIAAVTTPAGAGGFLAFLAGGGSRPADAPPSDEGGDDGSRAATQAEPQAEPQAAARAAASRPAATRGSGPDHAARRTRAGEDAGQTPLSPAPAAMASLSAVATTDRALPQGDVAGRTTALPGAAVARKAASAGDESAANPSATTLHEAAASPADDGDEILPAGHDDASPAGGGGEAPQAAAGSAPQRGAAGSNAAHARPRSDDSQADRPDVAGRTPAAAGTVSDVGLDPRTHAPAADAAAQAGLSAAAAPSSAQDSAQDSAQAGGAAPTAAQAAAPAPHAAQLGHALAAMHTGTDGSSHVVVRLDPAELGQVQVRITRDRDGAASVSVAVDRPETLRSLQADLGHLHQMLDRAGVPEQRSLTVHLATQDSAPATSAGNAGGQGTPGGSQFQHGARPDGAAAARGRSRPVADSPGGLPSPNTDPLRHRAWQRDGIDITA